MRSSKHINQQSCNGRSHSHQSGERKLPPRIFIETKRCQALSSIGKDMDKPRRQNRTGSESFDKVLELGIVVHSVIIGICLGASESPKTVKQLVAALTFHQFFEGMRLGGCISQAQFKSRSVAVMVLFFSLTTPVGIAIGMGISNTNNESSPTALIVEGIFDSASVGILTYMALVDIVAADFMSPKVQNNGKLQAGVSVSLLVGSGLMSLLAVWA